MRIGSLFSGVGGLELGLEWAGVGHTVWQVEKDPYARAVLAKHWPDATRYDDVCTVGAHNLEPVDVICGGFPCQDISYAGKGAGLAGARSGLWYEFARIVGELGPRFVVVENVAALLTRGIDAVLGTLADLGYDAEWSTLRASDVGAPHRRERVFLVAYARGEHGAQPHRRAHEPGQHAPRRGDDSRCGADVEHTAEPRREAPRASGLHGAEPRQSDAGLPAMGHPTRGGRGAVAGLEVRWADGGCQGVGDAECAGLEGLTGDGDRGDEPRWFAPEPDRPVAAPRVRVDWHDATPVRGADGTVRLIPAQAAQEGPQSPLWPVADGVPGRVARLRAIGNAVVPRCAEVVGRRLLEIDATLTRERAA